MKTRLFDGKVYIKASELAREHRYTSDYVGQLARGGKVEARLAGRSWYIYEPSLMAYIKRDYVAQPKSKPKSTPKQTPRTSAKLPALVSAAAAAGTKSQATPKPKAPAKLKAARKRAAKKPAMETPVAPAVTPTAPEVATGAPKNLWQKATSWFKRK